MTDKEKIREEVERLQNELIQEKKKGFGSDADDACILELQNVLTYIDSLKEEPVSEDLGEYINELSKQFPDVSFAKLSRIAVRVAKWQKEQFEKNRLEHCNSITNKQAELEQSFIDQHLDKNDRMPTFLDAIEYGMRLQKEQMMKGAIDGIARPDQRELWCNLDSFNLKYGNKVKVIVIKED